MTTQVAIRQDQAPEDMPVSLDAARKYIAPTATDQEFFLFANIAKSYGLNPFKREIHFIKYANGPGQSVVGYEAYIKRAERTGLLDGWNVVIGKDQLGEFALITIFRKDRTHPFTWTVYRHEFDSGRSVWKTMPLFMLRKVAISQGFRLAFPEEVGGMPYIPEELPATKDNVTSEELLKTVTAEVVREDMTMDAMPADWADTPPPAEAPAEEEEQTAVELSSMAQVRCMFATATEKGIDEDSLKTRMKSFTGKTSTKEVSKAQMTKFIDHLKSLPNKE